MYRQPPNLVAATVNTNAVANTNTTHVLIAGAAGQSIRVVAVRALLDTNEPAANVFRIIFLGTGGVGFGGCILQVGAVGSDGVNIPEPGIACDIAGGLSFVSKCNAVTRPVSVQVLYYIDNVS